MANLSYLWDVWGDGSALGENQTEWIRAMIQAGNGTAAWVSKPSALRTVLLYMRVYYTPTICVLGIVCNMVAVVTLLKSKLRYLSCSHYLAAIVIANSLHLAALLVQWMTLFDIDVYNRAGWCQFVSFANSVTTFLSLWYAVAYSVDRYVAVCRPLMIPTLCTTFRAKVVVIALAVTGAVVYMNISLTVGVISLRGKQRCSPLQVFLRDLRILTIVDMGINLIVPYTGLVVLTTLISKTSVIPVGGNEVVRRHTVPVLDDSEEACPHAHAPSSLLPRTSSRRHPVIGDVHMKKLSVCFLLVFLVSHLPSELFRLVHTGKGLVDEAYSVSRTEYYSQVISQHLYNTSLGCHLVIFLLCHDAFHKAMRLGCLSALKTTRKRWLRMNRSKDRTDANAISLNTMESGLPSPSFV